MKPLTVLTAAVIVMLMVLVAFDMKWLSFPPHDTTTTGQTTRPPSTPHRAAAAASGGLEFVDEEDEIVIGMPTARHLIRGRADVVARTCSRSTTPRTRWSPLFALDGLL